MIVKVIKEVTVEITQDEINQKRKSGGSFVNTGILKDDVNLAYIIANNKAVDAIASQNKALVKTTTSLDDQVDFKTK